MVLTAKTKFLQGLVPPQQLGDTVWQRPWIPSRFAAPAEANYVVSPRNGRTKSPPGRYEVESTINESWTADQDGVIQNLAVDFDLRRQSDEVVAGGLDLKASQGTVDEAHVDARGPQAQGHLVPDPVRGRVGMIAAQIRCEGSTDVDVPHTRQTSREGP